MCGPSSDLQALNKTVKGALDTAKGEAATVFGAASKVFNGIIGGLQRIVDGGPSQAGMSTAQLNAETAAAVQAGAAEARNLKGAMASDLSAIGGGNVPTSAGVQQGMILSAEQKAAADTAAAENAIVQRDFDIGNKNWQFAVGKEMQAPDVFNPATASEGAVSKSAEVATNVQSEVDKQNNWWQPIVGAAVGGVSRLATGGLTGGIGAGVSAFSNALPVAQSITSLAGQGGTVPAPDTSTLGVTPNYPLG